MVHQPGKSGKLKQRIVFCPPFAVTVLELFFFSLLCDIFTRKTDSSIFMGFSQMDMFKLSQEKTDRYKMSGDYSNFDQTLPSVLICASLFIFSCLINFGPEGSKTQVYYEKLY